MFILNLGEDVGFYHHLFGVVFPIGLLKEGLLFSSATRKSRIKSARYKPAASPKLSIQYRKLIIHDKMVCGADYQK
jgi:hypothetical protein